VGLDREFILFIRYLPEYSVEMSRIIVKGLSKSTKEGNIREQFSSKGEITDVKIVKTKDGKSRQFAFVGFRTNEQALDAIKHFNNTFLGTAKIIVELAKKIGDAPLNPFKSTKSMKGNKDVVSDEKIETTKETSVMTAREIKQAKEKADFLEAMKPRKNTKFWANDEGDITGTTNLDNNNNMNNTNDEGDSESVESSESDASETKVDKNNLTSLSALDYLKSKKVTSFSDSEDENEENETDNNRTDDASKDNQTYIDDNDEIDDTGRLFIRNLPFSVTEDELKELFASYGPITEVHLPLDSDRNRKGYGFVQFMLPEHALKAKDTLDGSSFQGRLLHIILAKKPREVDYSAIQNTKLSSFQLKKELNRKKNLNVKDGWNSSYLRSDTVIDAIASQYGVERSDIMDINEGSGEMAIRLAMGEAQIAQENKEYFVSHGVDITALDSVNSTNKSIQRSTTCLLIKNLPHDLVEDELKSMFTKYGPILSFLIPPSKSMALVNYKVIYSLAYSFSHFFIYLLKTRNHRKQELHLKV
jgi:multiple RNA-binding domain-containing protein 1